jgi:hypothetical protein
MIPRVSVIILNWNGWQDTVECLESLYRINYPHYDVVVVENHSTDQSIHQIQEYCLGNLPVTSKFLRYNPHNKPIKINEINENQINNQKPEQNHKNTPHIQNQLSTSSQYMKKWGSNSPMFFNIFLLTSKQDPPT